MAQAGRGPVLGPMVYAISYCALEYLDELANAGFADSKTLTAERRFALMTELNRVDSHLSRNVGWSVHAIAADDISAGMLSTVNNFNLNAQAHDATINLIKSLINRGINVRKV